MVPEDELATAEGPETVEDTEDGDEPCSRFLFFTTGSSFTVGGASWRGFSVSPLCLLRLLSIVKKR